MGKSIDITGKKYGNLTAIKYSHTNKVEYWGFHCSLCNNTGIRRKPDVTRGKIKSCGCLKNLGFNNGGWKGYETINGRTFGHYKKNAKKRNIIFDVTIEYLYDVYIKQGKTCPYTGYKLLLTPKSSKTRTPSNASLDRIDSKKGYIIGNIQWVFKDINTLKNDLSHNEFIKLCNVVARHCPYWPEHTKGNTDLKENQKFDEKNLED